MTSAAEALTSLRGQKTRCFVVALQVFLALVLVDRTMQSYRDIQARAQTYESIRTEHSYVLRAVDDHEIWEHSVGDDDSRAERIGQFYAFLTANSGFELATAACFEPLYSRLPDSNIPERIPTVMISPRYLAASGIGLSTGSWFDEYSYHLGRSWEYVPVVVGAEAARRFEIGDVFTVNDLSRFPQRVTVVGILEPESRIVRANQGDPVLLLDDAVLMPVLDPSEVPEQRFGIYDTYIQNSIILTHDADAALESIQRTSRALSLETYVLDPVDEVLALVVERTRADLRIYSLLLAVMVGFCSFGIVSSQLYRIHRNKRYYAILILCGSTKTGIVHQLFLEVFFMLAAGWLCFAAVGIATGSAGSTIAAGFLTIAGFSLALGAIPAAVIARTNLSSLLRRVE